MKDVIGQKIKIYVCAETGDKKYLLYNHLASISPRFTDR